MATEEMIQNCKIEVFQEKGEMPIFKDLFVFTIPSYAVLLVLLFNNSTEAPCTQMQIYRKWRTFDQSWSF